MSKNLSSPPRSAGTLSVLQKKAFLAVSELAARWGVSERQALRVLVQGQRAKMVLRLRGCWCEASA